MFWFVSLTQVCQIILSGDAIYSNTLGKASKKFITRSVGRRDCRLQISHTIPTLILTQMMQESFPDTHALIVFADTNLPHKIAIRLVHGSKAQHKPNGIAFCAFKRHHTAMMREFLRQQRVAIHRVLLQTLRLLRNAIHDAADIALRCLKRDGLAFDRLLHAACLIHCVIHVSLVVVFRAFQWRIESTNHLEAICVRLQDMRLMLIERVGGAHRQWHRLLDLFTLLIVVLQQMNGARALENEHAFGVIEIVNISLGVWIQDGMMQRKTQTMLVQKITSTLPCSGR
mmetsp:Transcript_16879/g.26214  ORF Transcript_16879/g.26214 Transcript_16879/m.26214 type:complete len:285 (-) Transcript_16879:150-1004(-)